MIKVPHSNEPPPGGFTPSIPESTSHGHQEPLSSDRTLYVLSATVWVAMIGMGIVWPLVPVYARELGASGLQVGFVISSFSLARALFNPFVGRFSDVRGRRPIISIGLLLYAVVSVLYVLVGGVSSLTLVRFLHGFTSILVIPVAMALAGDIAPRERLGLYMGTLNMAIMLGLGIGPALGGIIRESFGMESAFLTMGGLTLLTFFGVRIFIPADRYTGGLSKDRRAEPLRTVLRHRMVRGIFFLRLITSSGQGCVYTFLPLLALRIHVTSAQIGLILGVNILLIALLQRPFGALADRFNPVHHVAVGSMISGLSVLLMPRAGGFLELLCFNVIMGIGSGIAMPAGLALSGRVGRRIGLGAVIGVTDAGWSIGMIVSPITSGVIMDTLGLPWIFFVGGWLVCLGTALLFFYLKGYDPDTDSVPAKGESP